MSGEFKGWDAETVFLPCSHAGEARDSERLPTPGEEGPASYVSEAL
jgi:hypothetical protein